MKKKQKCVKLNGNLLIGVLSEFLNLWLVFWCVGRNHMFVAGAVGEVIFADALYMGRCVSRRDIFCLLVYDEKL